MKTHDMANEPKHLKYQPFYCEENIWHLCQHPDYLDGDVVFIAGYGSYFPMLCQQGCENQGSLVFWDYHVVLLKDGKIFDFNTTLPFSSLVESYFAQSFINESRLRPLQVAMFRVMPANEFVAAFQSDRSHMKTTDGWSAEPPEWPLISESSSNLDRFADMEDLEFGRVLSASELLNINANNSSHF